MTRRKLMLIAITVAASTVLFSGATGTASAATKDYSSPDGVCYTTGWCHWSEVCYDAFGGCYFDFWCPQGATSPSQCQYSGGFYPYATTATSSASGSGVGSSTSTTSTTSTTSSNSDVITSSVTMNSDSGDTGTVVTLNPGTDCSQGAYTSACSGLGTGSYSSSATTSVMNGGVVGYSDYGNFDPYIGWWR